MMYRLIVVVLMVLLSPATHAVQLPKSCGYDTRIRCIEYNPYELVKVTAVFGRQTFILFSPNEEVEDLGGGDTDGWDIGVIAKKNGIFIKPKAEKPATNITIITNKRYYNFDFYTAELKNEEDRSYMVKFTYPEDRVKESKKVSAKERTESLLANAISSKKKNDDYWVQGAEAFVPLSAWDDGETTYFRFAPNVELPNVYVVDAEGKETLANLYFPESYTLAVPVIAKKFVFRKGEVFTCVFNESYDKYGVENHSGTISPLVRRVIKEEARSEMDKKAEPQKIILSPAGGMPAIPGMMPGQVPDQGTPAMPAQPNGYPAGGLPTLDLTGGAGYAQ